MAQITDAIDSYYAWVETRVKTGMPALGSTSAVAPINATRVFKGIVQAASWPPSDIVYGALYLTIQNQLPNMRRGSISSREYRHVLQWSWANQGTDLTAGQTGANRGDRFRLDQEIRDELTKGNFPQFCPLVAVTLNQASGSIVRTPYNPVQMCRWTPLQFGPRPALTDSSGVLYGAAAVDVFAFLQPIYQ